MGAAAIYPASGFEGTMGSLNTYLTGAGGTAMTGNHWTITPYNSNDQWVCTNSYSSDNSCNFNYNGNTQHLVFRYGIAF